MGAPQSFEKIGRRTGARDGKIRTNVLRGTSQTNCRRQRRQERCNRLPAPFQLSGPRRTGVVGGQRDHSSPQSERDTGGDVPHPGSREWNGNARRDRCADCNSFAFTHPPALEYNKVADSTSAALIVKRDALPLRLEIHAGGAVAAGKFLRRNDGVLGAGLPSPCIKHPQGPAAARRRRQDVVNPRRIGWTFAGHFVQIAERTPEPDLNLGQAPSGGIHHTTPHIIARAGISGRSQLWVGWTGSRTVCKPTARLRGRSRRQEWQRGRR